MFERFQLLVWDEASHIVASYTRVYFLHLYKPYYTHQEIDNIADWSICFLSKGYAFLTFLTLVVSISFIKKRIMWHAKAYQRNA